MLFKCECLVCFRGATNSNGTGQRGHLQSNGNFNLKYYAMHIVGFNKQNISINGFIMNFFNRMN